MFRRASDLVTRTRERIRAAAEREPDGWAERDDERAILLHDGDPDAAQVLDEEIPDGDGGRPPLGSPEPGAPDVDVGGGGISGPPRDGRRVPLPGRRRTADRAPGGDTVPSPLRTAASWSWRLLLLGALLYGVLLLVNAVLEVFVPVLVALLLAALLQPGAKGLIRRGWPRSLAALVMLLVGVLVVAGIITLVISQVITDWESLTSQVTQGLTQIQTTIVRTFPITQNQLDQAIQQVQDAIGANSSAITSGAISTAGTVGQVFTGIFLVLLTLFFFLKDGRSIWLWVVGLLPRSAQAYADEAARRSWRTLVSLVRATVAVAMMDAIGIGIALLALRVPLALPLAALVFLGAFIPIIGSVIAGTVAVLVALVSNGLITALIVLGAVILVMQLEGHVFSPLLLGRAVKIHPLAVVLGVATGVIVAGIFGALIAVPVIACINVATSYLVHRHDGPRPPDPHPERARPAVTAG